MSSFSQDELNNIFELALKKKAVKQRSSEVSQNEGFSEVDILETAAETGISESLIRAAMQQVPQWKRLKRCRKIARASRAIGLTFLALTVLGHGAWFLGWLPYPSFLLIGAWMILGISGVLFRASYRKSAELEMDLALDDGKQLSEEMRRIHENYLCKKELNLQRTSRRDDSPVEVIESFFYLIAPPDRALIRYEIKRQRVNS